MQTLLTGNLILTSKATAATDTLKLKFKIQDLKTLTGNDFDKDFDFIPGQFVSLGFGDKAWRAYSIASVPSEAHLELMVRIVEGGVGSEAFSAAAIGDTIPFKGPFGHFQLSENEKAHLVFCATGTGIAPFRAMIKQEASQEKPRSMTLLYGGKNAADIAYLDEVNQWSEALAVQLGLSRDPNMVLPDNVQCETSNCRITQLLENLEISANHEFYLCGNGAMVKSVQEILADKKVPKTNVFMERFN
jgi:ferredoxin-NADP reductase